MTAPVLLAAVAAACTNGGRGPSSSRPQAELAAAAAPVAAAEPGPSATGRPAPSAERASVTEIMAGPLAVLRDTLGASSSQPSGAQDTAPSRPLEPPRELWRTRIGLTTYRSTLHIDGAQVVVGSNGADRKSKQDRDDVVWLLEAESGKATGRLEPRVGGERDCNGVALDDSRIIFGTDRDELYAFGRDQQPLWRARLDGDLESAPVIAQLDGEGPADVVVATEAGSIYGVDGANGNALWRVRAGKGDYGQTGFLASPAVADVTGDGSVEVFIGGRDGVMRSLEGATGKTRWSMGGRTGMHASPLLLDVEGDGRYEIAFSESYGTVFLADAVTGQVRWTTQLPIGLMGSMGWYADARCLVAGTAWFGRDERVHCVGVETGAVRWTWSAPEEKLSSGFVFGDVDGTSGDEVVFGTEQGWLVALDVDGQERWHVDLAAPIECTPTLGDLDGDDRVDVLVAGNDGYLRALETSGFPPVTAGYFRGSPANAGVF